MDDFDIFAGSDVISDSGAPMDFSTALQVAMNTLVAGGATAIANRITMGGTNAQIMPANNPALLGLGALPGIGSALGTLGRMGLGAAGAALGVIRSVGGRILGWVLPSGRRVTRKAAVSMAKQFGLVGTAAAIGATVEDLAQAVLDEESKPRRGRGITAANLRVTRRTIGKLERAHRQIAKAARSHTR